MGGMAELVKGLQARRLSMEEFLEAVFGLPPEPVPPRLGALTGVIEVLRMQNAALRARVKELEEARDQDHLDAKRENGV